MAYKINGVVILDNSGNLSAGVATATEFDGKVSEKSISEQTDGEESDVTGADEVLLYDAETAELLRVTVDEFVGGAGIGTIVSDFEHINSDSLDVSGITTVSTLLVSGITTMSDHLIIDDSTGAGTDYALNVKTTGTSRLGVLGNGAILLGNSSATPFIATNDHHATSKKYVDDAISAATDFDSLNVSGISTLGGEVSVGGSIIPDTNIAYDLGSDTNRFRDLYLEGNTIFLGDTQISADSVVTTANVGTASTGDQLTWTGAAWEVSSGSVAGVGGGSICVKYKCSSTTTMADPGNGKFRLNNATQENSTQLVVSVKTNGGYNINALLSNVIVGTKIFLQRKDGPDQYYAFIVNAVPTLTGTTAAGYYTFSDITGTVNGSTSLGDNKDCVLCLKAPDQVSGETITPAAVISDSVTLGVGGPTWKTGTGTPEGSVTAPVGSLFSRTDGGAGTSFYVKESGTGNTGWVAK